jgi:hypothetical protein
MSDERWEQRARRALDEAAESLDRGTRGRLAAARREAIAAGRGGAWHRAAGPLPALAAAAAVAAIAVTAWLVQPGASDRAPAARVTAFEVAASGEDLALLRDLEFYLWLEEQDGRAPMPEDPGGTG